MIDLNNSEEGREGSSFQSIKQIGDVMKFLKFSALVLSVALIAGCSDSSSSNGAPVNQPTTVTTPAPTPTPTPAPTAKDTRITVGEVVGNGRVQVPVSFEQLGNTGAAGLQFDINFDNTQLQMVEIRPGAQTTAAGKGVASTNLSATSSRVIISGNGNSALSNGEVAILVFDVIGTGTANITTSGTVVVDVEPQPGSLTVEEKAGKITIQ